MFSLNKIIIKKIVLGKLWDKQILHILKIIFNDWNYLVNNEVYFLPFSTFSWVWLLFSPLPCYPTTYQPHHHRHLLFLVFSNYYFLLWILRRPGLNAPIIILTTNYYYFYNQWYKQNVFIFNTKLVVEWKHHVQINVKHFTLKGILMIITMIIRTMKEKL